MELKDFAHWICYCAALFYFLIGIFKWVHRDKDISNYFLIAICLLLLGKY